MIFFETLVLFLGFHNKMFFMGRDDGPSLQKYINWTWYHFPLSWRITLLYGLNYGETYDLSDEEYKKSIFRWVVT